jgi:hypothetical protein
MKFALVAAAGLSAMTFAVAHAAPPAATTTAAATPAVVVYDEPNFKGRSVTITGATPDLTSVNFDNRVASFTITGGGDWVLCESRNYTGRCIRVQGQAGDLSLLQLSGRVSSLYPVPVTPSAPAPAKPN